MAKSEKRKGEKRGSGSGGGGAGPGEPQDRRRHPHAGMRHSGCAAFGTGRERVGAGA